jgi:transposase InsO family protein
MSSYYQYPHYSVEIKQAIAHTGDINLFPDLNIPKSTAREWLKKKAPEVISTKTLSILERASLKKTVKKQSDIIIQLEEKIRLIREINKEMDFIPSKKKFKDPEKKKKIISIIEKSQKNLTTAQVLKTISFSKSRLNRWKSDIKRKNNSSKKIYKQKHPQALSFKEFKTMRNLYTSRKYAHFPTSALHHLAKREDLLHCSLNTWYKYSNHYNFKRPYLRYNQKDYKQGIRASSPNEIWHIDISEIKLSSGRKYYLQTIVDNFSRYCLAWQINSTKEAFNTIELLRVAKKRKKKNTVLMMDKGGENINRKVDDILDKYKMTKVIAKFDTKYSNSIVEAFFRSIKNNYLYFQNPKNLKKLKEKVKFYIHEHNHKIPHSAHQGLTPHEVYTQRATKQFFKNLAKRIKDSIRMRTEVFYSIPI